MARTAPSAVTEAIGPGQQGAQDGLGGTTAGPADEHLSPLWPFAPGSSPCLPVRHLVAAAAPGKRRAAGGCAILAAAYRGAMGPELAGREYAGHLTDADLRLLVSVAAGAAGTGRAADGSWLRGDQAALLALLEHPGTFDAVMGQGEAAAGWAGLASPFLVFAVFVQRAATELAAAGYVPERTGPRQRVPLFDAPALRDFLAEPARRVFLAELLASFTRVASGRYRFRAGGRMRTRRFSELDPVRLAGLLEAVPRAERPGVYRRLGDVTLFLTGVFPDYAATVVLGPVNAGRLLRAAGLTPAQHERLAEAPAIELLEHLGVRWYRAARDLAPVPTARVTVVGEVADRFQQARRVLNHIADRYLFPPGSPWFTQPAS